jgi:hypothetical protein
VQELGERLTAEEFGEWQVMYEKERWRSDKARLRHAQVVVSTMQGPCRRVDGQPWQASHVSGPVDPWEVVTSPLPAKPVKRMSIAQQARAINAMRRGS